MRLADWCCGYAFARDSRTRESVRPRAQDEICAAIFEESIVPTTREGAAHAAVRSSAGAVPAAQLGLSSKFVRRGLAALTAVSSGATSSSRSGGPEQQQLQERMQVSLRAIGISQECHTHLAVPPPE